MEQPSGPTAADIEEYGRISDDDPTVDIEFDLEVTVANVELTFEQTHLLVEAGQIAGESPIAFMRNAALARAKALLTEQTARAESPAAGGG